MTEPYGVGLYRQVNENIRTATASAPFTLLHIEKLDKNFVVNLVSSASMQMRIMVTADPNASTSDPQWAPLFYDEVEAEKIFTVVGKARFDQYDNAWKQLLIWVWPTTANAAVTASAWAAQDDGT